MTAARPRRSDALEMLARRFGEKCEFRRGFLERYSVDQSGHAPVCPDAVVRVDTAEDVAAIMQTCGPLGLPVVGWGAGTSMEGNSIPVEGGVVVDMTGLDRILAVNAEDMDCHVEAGVDRVSLGMHLRDTGLFFPVDPGAAASLGGMAATRASGTMTMMYGSMRDNVIGLEVVMADGEIIETGGRTRKSSAGYDLTRLFVGSEGTLGLITKLRLRLHPVPEGILAATASFETIGNAVDCVLDFMHLNLPIARCELADEIQMAASIAFSQLKLDAKPTLFLEFQGASSEVAEVRQIANEVLSTHSSSQIEWAVRAEDRSRIWRARHDAGPAGRTIQPWSSIIITDVAVPISNLPQCISETREDLNKSGLVAPLVGHVGDGNFHLTLLLSDDQVEAGQRFNDRLIERALRLGGTCSGEHGIGLGKRKYMASEHGPSVDVMRRIKDALDPAGILNPGKIF